MMSQEISARTEDEIIAHETEVLRRFGLRWAVLAAWRDALRLRHVALPPEADRHLDNARIKLATGCFSVCAVGCDLSAVEGMLTSIDSSSHHNWVDFWLDLLAQSMTGGSETERILKIPAVKAYFQGSGIKGCACAG
jgi:hypothetical protein